MTAALLAYPELVRLPRRPGRWVQKIHLVAATLTANLHADIAHAADSIVVAMIPGIVLAGGKSSRMGRPKALLPIGSSGDTFFDRITRTLLDAGIHDVVVVVGADAEAIRAGTRPRAGVRIVDNPDYELGQLTSLLAGLEAIDVRRAAAALVTLIDVPLVSAATVRLLVSAQREHGAAIVRPVSAQRHGHPVIFSRTLFGELQRADPVHGAKPVVRAHAADMLEVPVDDEGAFTDIDTPEDYERFIDRS